MSEPLIQTVKLSKRYGDMLALDRLDLTVAAGEIVALLGANGAGKTTTLQLLLGFTPPSGGAAFLDGVEVARDPAHARRCAGYLPEVVQLYPYLTPVETLMLFEEISGRTVDRSAITSALDRVGLPLAAHSKRSESLSKGMRQKLGLAVALAKGARALLLDEPMSGLDPAAANDLVSLLRRLATENVAILMVTHDVFRAHQVANRIGIMRRGKLIENLDAAAITPEGIERIYIDHLRDVA